MRISRHDALKRGGTVIAFPGTFAAATATTMFAETSDASILALTEELDQALAEMVKARDRLCEAVTESMPPHLQHVDICKSREALRATVEAFKYPENAWLITLENKAKERHSKLLDRLSQTEATTLQGVHAKLRISMRPGYRIGEDIVRSAAADLERLSGRAVS